MADNYLEKKMDDYRSGRLKPAVVRASVAGNMNFGLRYDRLRVLLMGAEDRPMLALAKVLAAARAKVAAIGVTQQTSQTLGLRYYGPAMAIPQIDADLLRHWGGVDVVVTFEKPLAEQALKTSAPQKYGALCGPCDDPDAFARLAALALHPDNSSIIERQTVLVRLPLQL